MYFRKKDTVVDTLSYKYLPRTSRKTYNGYVRFAKLLIKIEDLLCVLEDFKKTWHPESALNLADERSRAGQHYKRQVVVTCKGCNVSTSQIRRRPSLSIYWPSTLRVERLSWSYINSTRSTLLRFHYFWHLWMTSDKGGSVDCARWSNYSWTKYVSFSMILVTGKSVGLKLCPRDKVPPNQDREAFRSRQRHERPAQAGKPNPTGMDGRKDDLGRLEDVCRRGLRSHSRPPRGWGLPARKYGRCHGKHC